MALTNGNTFKSKSGYDVVNTYNRIVKKDLNVQGNKIDVEFLIYKDKAEFVLNWRNFIPLTFENKAVLNYNREANGVDEMLFVHTRLKAYLMSLFPSWNEALLVIVDLYIPE